MKTVFFTCNTGSYDGFVPSIVEELPSDMTAYYLHDGCIPTDPGKGWEYIDLRNYTGCPDNIQLRQRFGRLLAHRIIPEHSASIYLDQKWFLPRAFFEKAVELLENTASDVVIPAHPDNRSLKEEIMFAYERGSFSGEYTLEIVEKLAGLGVRGKSFLSLLTTLILRKNTEEVNTAFESWYDLLNFVYTDAVRDQILAPYSGMKLSTLTGFDELIETTGCLRNLAYNPRVQDNPDLSLRAEVEEAIDTKLM